MPTNVLLVRWKDGWHEVVDAASVATHPRHEAFLALGALQSIAEVDRVAGMQLSVIAHPRVAVAADHDPIDLSDRPYRSYNVGDIITVPNYGTGTSGQRVRAITGAEDESGEVTYSPELGDLLLEEQERVMQAVKKMSDGTLEGESAVAQPTRVYVPAIMAKPVPKVKGAGQLKVATTRPPYSNNESGYLRTISESDRATPASFRATATTLGMIDGQPAIVEAWQLVPGGDGSFRFGEVYLGYGFDPGDTFEGTISTTWLSNGQVLFGPEHGVTFRTNDSPFAATVELVFAEHGQTYTVGWDTDA
jgi:hypothetical protein